MNDTDTARSTSRGQSRPVRLERLSPVERRDRPGAPALGRAVLGERGLDGGDGSAVTGPRGIQHHGGAAVGGNARREPALRHAFEEQRVRAEGRGRGERAGSRRVIDATASGTSTRTW